MLSEVRQGTTKQFRSSASSTAQPYDLPPQLFFLIVGQNSGITNDFAFVISGIVFDSKPSMSAQRRIVLVETPYCFAR